MVGEQRRFSIPEAASVNGSFRRCRQLFCLRLCLSSKMPSSSKIFRFWRVASPLFLTIDRPTFLGDAKSGFRGFVGIQNETTGGSNSVPEFTPHSWAAPVIIFAG